MQCVPTDSADDSMRLPRCDSLHDTGTDKDADMDTDAYDASLQIPQMTQCGCHSVTAIHYEDVGAPNLLHHGIEDATFQ